MNSNKKQAHIAGILYLLLAITGMFGLMYVPSKIFADNVTDTINNITASPTLFRMGIVSNLISQTLFVILAVVFYRLLSHVNKMQAYLMVAFVLVAVPISFANSLNYLAVLTLISGGSSFSGLDTQTLHAYVTLFLELHTHGVHVVLIFWGLWLFPLGYLVYKSGWFPRIFGILLMLACFAYLIEFFVVIFIPQYYEITYPGSIISSIAEFSFLLWLTIKGANTPIEQPAPVVQTA
jgi:hypothetical protein